MQDRSAVLSVPWLLVAAPQLSDPNFARSVVLIVDHSERGAFGFILNRQVRTPLSQLVDLPGLAIKDEVPAWYGGPVGTDLGVVLQWRPGEAPGGVFVSGHQTELRAMLSSRRDEPAGDAQIFTSGGTDRCR